MLFSCCVVMMIHTVNVGPDDDDDDGFVFVLSHRVHLISDAMGTMVFWAIQYYFMVK
jgi:hypothetical protein